MSKTQGLNVGQRVKCTGHGGTHHGTVARVLVPDELYVIAWHGKGTSGAAGRVRVGNVVMKYPRDLVENHLLDLTSCEASKVEPA